MNSDSKNIHILALVPYKIFPAIMGGQKGIALFYKYLSTKCTLTCVTTKKNESHENYTLITSLSNSRFRYINPLFYFQYTKIIADKKPTHLLFEHPYFAWLIILLRFLTAQKIIVHSHNIESIRFKSIGKWWWKILWYYERAAYRNAHFVWFKTQEDKRYAITHFGIRNDHCLVLPYGIEADHLPTSTELISARAQLEKAHAIQKDALILLFNGTLNYTPNLDALKNILTKINPILLARDLRYKIIICGKNLPVDMNELKDEVDKNIIYCGFVEDIDVYFKGCSIFLNPVEDGGGIKTKLVEALGFGKPCISSANGAIGVPIEFTDDRLKIIEDKNWVAYYNAILQVKNEKFENDNSQFYANFSWDKIATKAIGNL